MVNPRHKIYALGYVTVVLLVLLSAASYAWLTISDSPMVSDLAISVVTDNAMEIAPDVQGTPGEWGTILDLSDYSALTAPLKPATFRASEGAFYAPGYGADGRIANAVRLTNPNDTLLSAADAAEDAADNGYLYTASFWLRSPSRDTDVFLSPPVTREQDTLGGGTFVVGEPVWNENTFRHDENGNGAEKAVRMAFRVEVPVFDSNTQKLDENGKPLKSQQTGTEIRWVLYEPNTDESEVTYGMDGGELQGDWTLVRQQASSWQETDPILADKVLYTPGDFFENEIPMLTLTRGVPTRVTLYLWLEGQDRDCSNIISAGSIFANLQFAPSTDNHNMDLRPE